MIIKNAHKNKDQWVLHARIGGHESPKFKKINSIGRSISIIYCNYIHFSDPQLISLKIFFNISGLYTITVRKKCGYYEV